MKTTLTVTDRGTITLAAKLRRQLGIKADDQLIAEATPEGLLLRPAVTLPVEIYSDARIAEFDAAEAELGEVLRRKRPVSRRRRNLAAKGPQGLPALAALLDQLEVAPLQADRGSLTALSALPERDRPVVAAAARMTF